MKNNSFSRFDWITFCLLVLGICIRICFLPFVSDDLTIAFLPWYGEVARRGFPAIGDSFYTYSSVLLLFFWIMSFLGHFIVPLILVKIPSLLFEIILAAGIGRIVSIFVARENRRRTFWRAFALSYLLPTLVLNGAAWGQCDALYAAPVVWALVFMLDSDSKTRSLASHLAFGAALIFKLQCIFFAPLYLVLYLRKRLNPFHLLWVPVVYGVAMLPALFAGRTPSSLVLVYLEQSGIFRSLSMNAPTFYAWISDEYYDWVYPRGVVFAAVTLLLTCYGFARRMKTFGAREILALAAFFTWFAPNLLPKMHERYFYLAEVLTLTLALTSVGKRKWITWGMVGLIQTVSLLTYSRYLFQVEAIPPVFFPLFHFAIGALWILFFRMRGEDSFQSRCVADEFPKGSLYRES